MRRRMSDLAKTSRLAPFRCAEPSHRCWEADQPVPENRQDKYTEENDLQRETEYDTFPNEAGAGVIGRLGCPNGLARRSSSCRPRALAHRDSERFSGYNGRAADYTIFNCNVLLCG